MNDSDQKSWQQKLRAQAEKIDAMSSAHGETSQSVETLEMIYELQIHQIELELQNSELQSALTEADSCHQRYKRLYDLSPVGLMTCHLNGTIMQVNKTLCEMLARNPDELEGTYFHRFCADHCRMPFTFICASCCRERKAKALSFR